MTRFSKYFKNIWARRRWAIIITLALVLVMPVTYLVAPQTVKWNMAYALRNFWRALTENWGDKWDRALQILGINTVPEGAQIVAACADCDVCAAVQTRYFHRYNVADVKAIMKKTTPRPVVVDVRLIEEFETGHIPGALNMPLSELKADIWSADRGIALIVIGRDDEDWRVLGKDIVEKWKFYNAGYLVGGMKVWDGEIETER